VRKLIVKKLRENGYKSGNSGQIADWLLQKITGKNQIELLSRPIHLSEKQKGLLDQLIRELVEENKPLQYILGFVPFCGFEILVESPVLIPRPETEEWVSELILRYDLLCKSLPSSLKLRNGHGRTSGFNELNRHLKILDLCTGSGCIALAIAQALPEAEVIGSDISKQAIKLAKKNKDKLNIQNVSFVQYNLFEQFENQQFDLIVTNPPYVTEHEWQELELNVKNWEDKMALVGGDYGLDLIKKIIEQAPKYLKRNSLSQLVLEIGSTQAEAVCTFMQSYGYTDVQVKKDFADCDRVGMGCYGAMEKK